MSRSGYTDDECEQWEMICWRGAVASAIRGRRGQALLREMRDALLALEDKRLAIGFTPDDGCTCALGVVGRKRGMVDDGLRALDAQIEDGYNREVVAETFGVADALTAEVMWMNDEFYSYSARPETPEQRYQRMLKWVESKIRTEEEG